jgi:hypothetical protein
VPAATVDGDGDDGNSRTTTIVVVVDVVRCRSWAQALRSQRLATSLQRIGPLQLSSASLQAWY